MKIAILGCGPAGLLAAHAAVLLSEEPVIYSRKIKSEIAGAQYVHEPIPGATDEVPDFDVTYRKMGTREGYAEKVYGDASAPCSWDEFPEGFRSAWSMRAMYDRLWDRYKQFIVDSEIASGTPVDLIQQDYDLIISSIPAPELCYNPAHRFEVAHVFILRRAWREVEPGEVVYNGEPTDLWYRSSLLDGEGSTEFGKFLPVGSVEYASGDEGEVMPLINGKKPIWTNCDCWRNVERVGRFGRWEKGVLVHDAFVRASDLIQERLVAA